MTNQTSAYETPGYMGEYWEAFSPVPFTNEDEQGKITDMNTHEEVAVPATHPDFAHMYGTLATRQVAEMVRV